MWRTRTTISTLFDSSFGEREAWKLILVLGLENETEDGDGSWWKKLENGGRLAIPRPSVAAYRPVSIRSRAGRTMTRFPFKTGPLSRPRPLRSVGTETRKTILFSSDEGSISDTSEFVEAPTDEGGWNEWQNKKRKRRGKTRTKRKREREREKEEERGPTITAANQSSVQLVNSKQLLLLLLLLSIDDDRHRFRSPPPGAVWFLFHFSLHFYSAARTRLCGKRKRPKEEADDQINKKRKKKEIEGSLFCNCFFFRIRGCHGWLGAFFCSLGFFFLVHPFGISSSLTADFLKSTLCCARQFFHSFIRFLKNGEPKFPVSTRPNWPLTSQLRVPLSVARFF